MSTTARTADTASADATPTALGEHRELIRAAIGELVDRLDPQTARAVRYHLGWCDPDGNPSGTAGGKSLRPTLALLGAAAAGGKPEQAVAGAVAAELVHNFSLVHDDLMDRDATRRHRATVWSVWGDPAAVLTGDAMLSLAYEVLLTSGTEQAPWAGRVLAQATRELIAGQAADIDFEQRRDVTLAECLAMTIGKTSALLGASAGIGAILAGGDDALVQSLIVYGRELGIAFQLVDDLLGMWGNPDETGKPVHSDLRARKKTLPITWSIENGGSAGSELARWMARDRADPDDEAEVKRAADLVVAAGGRQWAESEARHRLDRGYAAIADADTNDEHRQQFFQIGEYVLHRRS
jgi:geranylgeranyl diphosphate synthase type I